MKYDLDLYNSNDFIRDKLKYAIDYRYSHIEERKRRKEFEKDYDDLYKKDDGSSIESSLKQYLAGYQKPSIDRLMRICNVLDCDIDYFLTEQTELKKEIANASDITGLKYKSIDLLNDISRKKSPLAKITLQFLDLVLSSKENYNEIITSLACIIFHLDDNESDRIAYTYDNNTTEDTRCFTDETNLKDYYLNYGNKYYNDSMRNQYYDSMLLLEISKFLEHLKIQERKYRESYKGNIEIVILEEDYENEDNYVFENNENGIKPLNDTTINITREKTTS